MWSTNLSYQNLCDWLIICRNENYSIMLAMNYKTMVKMLKKVSINHVKTVDYLVKHYNWKTMSYSDIIFWLNKYGMVSSSLLLQMNIICFLIKQMSIKKYSISSNALFLLHLSDVHIVLVKFCITLIHFLFVFICRTQCCHSLCFLLSSA